MYNEIAFIMSNIQPLQYDTVYHIYNRGVNKMQIFRTPRNYRYFLSLYFDRIGPLVDTYAWCLMSNHFHFMLRIKSLDEIFKKLSSTMEPVKLKRLNPSRQFANFFIAYARAFNIQERRRGALFERPFGRIVVDNDKYFKDLITYIHRNPVHHGFVEHPRDYPWSSYDSYFRVNPSRLEKDTVFSWFDSTINFKNYHHKKQKYSGLKEYLMDDANVL